MIHTECEAWTLRCPTYGCRGPVGQVRRVLGAFPPPGRRASFAPQPREVGPLPPPGRRASFARAPRPIPVHPPRDRLRLARIWEGLFDPIEDSGLLALVAYFLVLGTLALIVGVPSLAPKTGLTRTLLLLVFWAQATRSSADLAGSAADGISNLRR